MYVFHLLSAVSRYTIESVRFLYYVGTTLLSAGSGSLSFGYTRSANTRSFTTIHLSISSLLDIFVSDGYSGVDVWLDLIFLSLNCMNAFICGIVALYFFNEDIVCRPKCAAVISFFGISLKGTTG